VRLRRQPILGQADPDLTQNLIDAVTPLLEDALAKGMKRRDWRENLVDFSDESQLTDWPRGLMNVDPTIVSSLIGALAAHTTGIEGSWLMATPNGPAELVTFSSLSSWLLERSLDTRPTTAITELCEFLSKKRGHYLWVQLVYGVDTSVALDLGYGFTLMPFEMLPTTRQKRAFERRHLGGGFHVMHKPAALTFRDDDDVILRAPSVLSPEKGSQPVDGWLSREFRLESVATLLCLLGDHLVAPLASGSWPQAAGVGVPAQGMSHFTWADGPAPWAHMTIDPDEAKAVIGQFQKLNDNDQKRLLLSTRRLGRSMRPHGLEDSFTDLRTCLESALKEDASSEIAFQVAIRGSWLIGADPEDRRKIFGKLKKAYDYGSKAVHTGRIKPPKKQTLQNEADDLKEAQKLAQRILRKLVEQGMSVLDFIELGGPLSPSASSSSEPALPEG
jgi:Apea-like HEPN